MTGFDLHCGDCGVVRSCSHDYENHAQDHDPDCGVHAAYGPPRTDLRFYVRDVGWWIRTAPGEWRFQSNLSKEREA